MRMTVDEKLQKTLEDRISQSFKQVSEQLEAVYKGLGEMNKIGLEVGDLKESFIQCENTWDVKRDPIGFHPLNKSSPLNNSWRMSRQSPAQKNVLNSLSKLPGDESGPVLLPIDSKFPTEDYVRLLDASILGDKVAVDIA